LTTLTTALGLLIVDIIFPGVDLANFPAALLAAAAIGLINASVRPFLTILSLPITFLTLGAFSLVVNGLCFWLASVLIPGFTVHGLLAFLLSPVLLSVSTTFLSKYFAEKGMGQSLPGENASPSLTPSDR
jgi:putative membrane protein